MKQFANFLIDNNLDFSYKGNKIKVEITGLTSDVVNTIIAKANEFSLPNVAGIFVG